MLRTGLLQTLEKSSTLCFLLVRQLQNFTQKIQNFICLSYADNTGFEIQLGISMTSYCFLHGEHKLNVQKHRNQKIGNLPYVRTKTRTLTDIRTTSETIQPKQVASHIYQQRGGISTESVSQLTRSRQQLSQGQQTIHTWSWTHYHSCQQRYAP